MVSFLDDFVSSSWVKRGRFLAHLLGQQALIAIVSHLLFITITWWALQGIHIERLMKHER